MWPNGPHKTGQSARRATYARGHDPEPGVHGTLSAREPVPARQAVGLEASSAIPSGRSHLAGHRLAPVKAGQVFGGGDAFVQ
jgi:hypothetical protein